MKITLLKLRQIRLFAIVLLMFSCKDDDVVTPPDPEEPGMLELKLESHKVVAFQSIEDSQETGTLAEDKIEEYFGSRVQSFIPVEITISDDSTTFVKAGSLKEKFRTKWENNDELYLYDGNNETWSLLGKKSGESFLLKSAFFFKKVHGQERNSNIIGQAYALENYNTFISPDEQYSLIWLRIDASYN